MRRHAFFRLRLNLGDFHNTTATGYAKAALSHFYHSTGSGFASLAGIGGAQMSCIYTLGWANDMINGRGFIASALVILCSWKPLRAYMAAYLFGLARL